MISSKLYVDQTLKKYNLVANKSLGQNFLVEEEIAKYIVDSAALTPNSCVIEVGPGLGALSEFIVKSKANLYAFEIDKNMVNILSDTFSNYDNFHLQNIDFLKVDIDELLNNLSKKEYDKIVFMSNLPYYITCKLLAKLVSKDYPLDNIIVMMQKEVGQKLIKPDKKDINQLYCLININYDASIVKYVGKNSYLPRPEIDSIVLSFKKKDNKIDVNFDRFNEVLNHLFTNRRKTIYNNLKGLVDDNKLENVLNKCNIDKNMHVEQLSFEQIIKISNLL